ncbi:tetratricopeptide repeat protein [Serratia sp. L9]|uniref:tetratricopeptide repeat protein n=1 Tax=Serratia sp. L9 TaxID=3423946 RepID=UPI003D664424
MHPFQKTNPPLQEQRLNLLAQQYRDAIAQNDFAAGKVIAEVTLRLVPRNPDVLASYALCLMRTGEYQKSYKTYKKLLQSLPFEQLPETMIDGLAEVCGWLNRPEEVRRYGLLSLEHGDKKFGAGPAYPLPAPRPPAFNPQNPQENVIAFTLFGALVRYCESAVVNARASKTLFPAWQCRFYLDDSVPQEIQQRLLAEGAQVIKVEGEQHQSIPPLMWRFLVLDDPKVKRYLIRDADSLLSEREQAAVEAWLQSDRWYHHMRDYFTHTELLLAGMWGGCRNENLPSIIDQTRVYLSQQEGHRRFVDQYFLRQYLWPTLKQSLLNHDELFGFHDAQPYPAHPPIRWQTDKFHIGSNASYQLAGTPSQKNDGEIQRWEVLDEQGNRLCQYASPVKNHEWRELMPFFLLDPVMAGEWQLRNID